MYLSYLRENDARLQCRQPWVIVHVDVTVTALHVPRTYAGNMAVCVHCIRPI